MIHPHTSIGAVHLSIADLDRSLRFYEGHLGFARRRDDGLTAELRAAGDPNGDALLVLHASPGAVRTRGTTGLYHFAILAPSRPDLARSFRRLVETATPLQGAADHGVSEALYFADPDGNGIEIYRDRPKADWPIVGGRLRMGAAALDLDGLLRESDRAPASTLAPATTIGQVHLHVSDLAAAERFYIGVLGFGLTQRYGPAAIFVAAGGYHHPVGLNTWAGVGAPPPPLGAIGLRHFEVRLPDRVAVNEVVGRLDAAGIPTKQSGSDVLVRDPSGNALLLVAGP